MTAEEFRQKLIALCKEAEVTLGDSPQYDGADEYCGAEWEFYGPTWALLIDRKLAEAIES